MSVPSVNEHLPSPLLQIFGEGGTPIVVIDRDGSVSYGEGVDLDEQSRRFWEAVAGHVPPPASAAPAPAPEVA